MIDGESSALQSKTIVITRAGTQAEKMADLIRDQGGVPYVSPFIRLVEADNDAPLDAVLAQMHVYDMLLFTSVNGVRFFLKQVKERLKQFEGRNHWPSFQQIQHKTVVAVGSETAQSLKQEGFQHVLVPERYKQEEMLQLLQEKLQPAQRVLFPRAEVVRPYLGQHLRKYGIAVDEVIVYRTLPVYEEKKDLRLRLEQGGVDILTFTSPSTVLSFDRWLSTYMQEDQKQEVLKSVTVGCIGPVTAGKARQLGFSVHVSPEIHTIQGLINELQGYMSGQITGSRKEC